MRAKALITAAWLRTLGVGAIFALAGCVGAGAPLAKQPAAVEAVVSTSEAAEAAAGVSATAAETTERTQAQSGTMLGAGTDAAAEERLPGQAGGAAEAEAEAAASTASKPVAPAAPAGASAPLSVPATAGAEQSLAPAAEAAPPAEQPLEAARVVPPLAPAVAAPKAATPAESLSMVQMSITGDKERGMILAAISVDFKEGDTALDVLQRIAKQKKIQLEYRGSASATYIEGIDNLYEFDKGAKSGWLYRVNGSFPNKSAGAYLLAKGDRIEWLYTIDLGRDVGKMDNPKADSGSGSEAGSSKR